MVQQSLASRAPRTVKKYIGEHKKFIQFLTSSRRSTELPSSHLCISIYLAFLSQTKQSYTAVLLAFSAIKWVHSLLPTDRNGNPAETTLSMNIVEASKRAFSKPIRKKEPISTVTIINVCRRFASPSCTLKELRTAVIFFLGFTGLFIVSELLRLKARAVTLKEEHLEILVPGSKTDQYHQGNKVYIAKTNGPACPHSLLLRFYSLSGVNPTSEEYLIRSLSSYKAGKLTTARNNPISYSRCREIIKETLAAVGENPELFSTHSLRSGGATAIAQCINETPGVESLRLERRWKSDSSRDTYIKDSLSSRLAVTKSLKL